MAMRTPRLRKAKPADSQAESPPDQVGELVRQNQELLAQNRELMARLPSQFVEQQPDPTPPMKEAVEGDLTDWQRDILGHTRPKPEDFKRDGTYYNFPLKWFARQDGMVVQLQGDPTNTEYYRKKGFHELEPEEVERYLTVERPTIVARQNEKAALVNAIRRAGERYKDLSLEDTFDDYSVDEIREYLAQIKAETGKDIRIIKPRRQAEREAAEEARLMSGVETNATVTLETFEAKIGRKPSRTVEVTSQNARQFR